MGLLCRPRNLVLLVFYLVASAAVSGQRRLELPFGPITRLASPDDTYVLYGNARTAGARVPDDLWIDDKKLGKHTRLLGISDTLAAGWSPHGAAFFVEDHQSSSGTLAYIYEVPTLRRLDIAKLIRSSDPQARRFFEGHAYFNIEGWMDDHSLRVEFVGHTDSAPVKCFNLRYSVSRQGNVNNLLRLVVLPDDSRCKG